MSTIDGPLQPLLDDDETNELRELFALGNRIDERYLLLKPLGEGGMGQVFLALDERLEREVALKVVSKKCTNEQQVYETMLAREARLGANLNHPSIAAVYDFGIFAGRSYTVFEYVNGRDVRARLCEDGPLDLDEMRAALADLAAALDFAHGQGVVHRDLKPENICVSQTGQYKVLDFGIAMDVISGFSEDVFSGTPAYAAPEQVKASKVDGKTDQYALACIAFELLTGERIFTNESPIELLRCQVHSAPRRISECLPRIPLDVDAALLRALEKNPQHRFSTCREFAAAMGCYPENILVSRLQREPIKFYICHVADDSIFARKLGNLLEGMGFSCWYYQRDAVPGLSLISQTSQAVHQSAACMTLISRNAMESAEFVRELQQAHRAGCAFVPVLLDLSHAEFDDRDLPWNAILGPIAKIEADRGNVNELAEKLRVAACMIGLNPEKVPPKANEPNVVQARQTWSTDAYQIDINEIEHVVFQNEVVTDFLNRKNRCFISATKGLGKTLLLTYKRLLTTKELEGTSTALTLIPQGRPFLDFMGDLRQISKKLEAPLCELPFCKRVWSCALKISAISHQDADFIEEHETTELAPFPQRLQDSLRGRRIQPSLVFKELTRLSVSELSRLLDDADWFLDLKVRQIHAPIYMFVDKVDQAIRNLPALAWTNVQAGLVEAAWDLMNANSHIKVFASIRHEAFSNYESDIKSNLSGAVTYLRYTDFELAELMDCLSQRYESTDSFKEFIGLNVVRSSSRRPFLEDSFRFMLRHTFARPRDLVVIASELSSRKTSLTENRFCDLVRETASAHLVSSVFDERKVFLECLDNKSERTRFLAQIPANVLDADSAMRITLEFNGLPPEANDHYEADEGLFRPFRDLYLAGVLGIVETNEAGEQSQHFKQPSDIINPSEFRLPKSQHYLVHPAMDHFIQKNRSNSNYMKFQHVLIGNQLPWRWYFEQLIRIETSLARVQDARFVDVVHQMLEEFQRAARNQEDDELDSLVTSPEWKWVATNPNGEAQEDVVLWLGELLQAT